MTVTCEACQGAGLFQVPVPKVDDQGRPYIEHDIRPCSACAGQGKVNI